jgi:hypothetical protein
MWREMEGVGGGGGGELVCSKLKAIDGALYGSSMGY